MGAAPSSGKNNDELIDCLVDNNCIRYRSVEFAFRIVDRGDYFPESKRENAYKDQAWKSEDTYPIHISAPCIYANALEYLDLQPGQSFLNIGSGTGYFNALAGYLLTETGTNHGVEIYESLIKYAYDILQNTAIKRSSMSAFSFCVPEFFNGSAFYIKNGMSYDRIYVGALVPKNRRLYFCNMLKIGGILVMPYGSRLIQIVRRNQKTFIVYQISNVSFSQLITPSQDNPRTKNVCELPQFTVRPLIELCRTALRSHIRQNLFTKKSIQVQFEVGVTKESDVQESNEQRMERIGTLYFMGHRNEDAAQQNQAVGNEEAVVQNDQNIEQNIEQRLQNEEQIADPHPIEEDELRDLFETPPPLEENQEIDYENRTPQLQREPDEPMLIDENPNQEQIIQQNVPIEDGLDAEAAVLNQIEEEPVRDAQNQRQEVQRFAVHLNPNQNAAAIQRLQNRRHRLHVNLVNGNRLIGFLNTDDDDENEEEIGEELVEDGIRVRPTASMGFASYDTQTSATFHTTDLRPSIDNIDMAKIIPNYIEPTPTFKPKIRSDSVNSAIQRSDASTLTDNIRDRPPRFAVRLRATPIAAGQNNNNQVPVRHAILNRIRQAAAARQAQPSTSNQTATSNTQTETQNVQPNQRLEDANQVLHGIQQSIQLLHNRHQRVRQLFDRMQRFNTNLVPTLSRTQTTAATADLSSTPTTSSPSTSRSGLKRKIENEIDVPVIDSSVQLSASSDNESSSTSTKPKISRSSSMPDFLQEQQFRSITSNLLDIPQQPSQSSSLRPDSPMLSSSVGEPSSPASSITTTISSVSSSVHSGTSISGRSDAISETSGGDLSSIAGGSTASSAQTVSTMDTTSGFGTDEQQGQEDAENEKRQKQRAEHSLQYKKDVEEFHSEFQRCLESLPLSKDLIRFVCYNYKDE